MTNSLAMDVDIEYDNGFRETVRVKIGDEFKLPFNGRIVGTTPVTDAPAESASRP